MTEITQYVIGIGTMLTLFLLGYLETKRGYKVFDHTDIQVEI